MRPKDRLEPGRLVKRIDIPEFAVACFFQDVIAKLVAEHKAEQVAQMQSEIGINPVYKLEWQGKALTVFHPGVGAPLAAAFLDEVIALGCTKFVACGGCGVLNSALVLGHIIVPDAAVRDEGNILSLLATCPGSGCASGGCSKGAGRARQARDPVHSRKDLDNRCYL